MVDKVPRQFQENWHVLIYPGSPLAESAGGAYLPKTLPYVGKGVLPGAFHDPHIHKSDPEETVGERSVRYAMFSKSPAGRVAKIDNSEPIPPSTMKVYLGPTA